MKMILDLLFNKVKSFFFIKYNRNMIKNIKKTHLIIILLLASIFIVLYNYNSSYKNYGKLEQFYQDSIPTQDPNVGKILIMNPIRKKKDSLEEQQLKLQKSLCDPENPKLCIHNLNVTY